MLFRSSISRSSQLCLLTFLAALFTLAFYLLANNTILRLKHLCLHLLTWPSLALRRRVSSRRKRKTFNFLELLLYAISFASCKKKKKKALDLNIWETCNILLSYTKYSLLIQHTEHIPHRCSQTSFSLIFSPNVWQKTGQIFTVGCWWYLFSVSLVLPRPLKLCSKQQVNCTARYF